jgi:predicted transcriptional regulator
MAMIIDRVGLWLELGSGACAATDRDSATAHSKAIPKKTVAPRFMICLLAGKRRGDLSPPGECLNT